MGQNTPAKYKEPRRNTWHHTQNQVSVSVFWPWFVLERVHDINIYNRNIYYKPCFRSDASCQLFTVQAFTFVLRSMGNMLWKPRGIWSIRPDFIHTLLILSGVVFHLHLKAVWTPWPWVQDKCFHEQIYRWITCNCKAFVIENKWVANVYLCSFFIVRSEVYSSIIVSFCSCDRWERLERVMPQRRTKRCLILFPMEFPFILALISWNCWPDLVYSGQLTGTFRPVLGFLQTYLKTEVFVKVTAASNMTVKKSASMHVWCVTQFLQSLPSRQSYNQKGFSVCPRMSVAWWRVGQKHTACHHHGQHPPSHDRGCLVRPINWVRTSSKSRY